MFPARSPWRHQSELTEKAWEKAVQRPGNLRHKKSGAFHATQDTSGKSKVLRKLQPKGTSSGDVVASRIQPLIVILLTMDTRKGSVKVQPFYKKKCLILSVTGSLQGPTVSRPRNIATRTCTICSLNQAFFPFRCNFF